MPSSNSEDGKQKIPETNKNTALGLEIKLELEVEVLV